jgi:S1-C subfamily serine protease
MTTIDRFSLCTIPLEILANEKPIGVATGFIWKLQEKHYLVTNWHVITGRNARTGKLELAARPDSFRALFNVRAGEFGKSEANVALRDKNGHPLWLVHPSSKGRIDVVVLPINLFGPTAAVDLSPINLHTAKPLRIRIGMEVFILGYPFGMDPPGFPVWKRGTIASEPDLVSMTTGYYLVDTASRPGMSGAPVILQNWTSDYVEGSVRAITDTPATNIIGVYSGRLHAAADEAQIGMVWHVSYIEEIIAGNTRDTD